MCLTQSCCLATRSSEVMLNKGGVCLSYMSYKIKVISYCDMIVLISLAIITVSETLTRLSQILQTYTANGLVGAASGTQEGRQIPQA